MQKLILDIPEDDYIRLGMIFDAAPDYVKELTNRFSDTLDLQAETLRSEMTIPDVHERKAIAFVGDSLTSDRESFMNILRRAYRDTENLTFIDAAVSGDKSDDARMKFYFRTLNHHPDIVHILLGTNDMRENKDRFGDSCLSLQDYERNLEYMVKSLTEEGGKVILSTIPPICNTGLRKRFPDDNWIYRRGKIDSLNEILETVADRNRVKLNDMRPVYEKYDAENLLLADGLHLNEKGQRLLAQNVLKSMAEYL